MDIKKKPRVMLTFREGDVNGGPYNSHKRIMESRLKEKYEFVPLIIPKGHLGIYNRKVIKIMSDAIKECKPDIVHFTGLELVGWYSMLAAKKAGVKNTVMVIRGSTSEAIEFNKNKLKKFAINIIEMLTLKNAKYIYGVSEYVGTLARVKKYAKDKYIGHIYNLPAPGTIEYKSGYGHIRDEFQIKDSDVLVVSTGRVIAEKGYDTLKDIIIKGSWNKSIKFFIAGEGNYLDEMKSEISKAGLLENVIFAGYREDVNDILRESNIFVICTKHETLCNAVIEAANNHLPVVASRVGGIPEIVDDGNSGFLVDKEDVKGFIEGIKELAENKQLRTCMGSEGKKRIDAKFSIRDITGKIDTLYQKVLKD